jgi:hypothetical protein
MGKSHRKESTSINDRVGPSLAWKAERRGKGLKHAAKAEGVVKALLVSAKKGRMREKEAKSRKKA